MKLLYAFGFIPVPAFFANWSWLIGGFTWPMPPWPLIILLEKYRTDEGLHHHEIYHVERALKMGLLPWAFLWLVSESFRMREEVAGYRVQFKYPSSNGGPPISVDKAVDLLLRNYHLSYKPDELRMMLTCP
jgi:hypothetical protein